MFSCPSCLRRAVNNLNRETSSSITSPLLSKPGTRITRERSSKRHHATYDSLVTGHHRRAFRLATANSKELPPNHRRKGAGSLTKGEIKDAVARNKNRGRLLAKDDTNSSYSTPDDRRLQIHLKKDVEQYYSDPLQLANAVTAKLRIPDFETAIALVRASEGIVMKNVVSWNHCIDWCMSQGDTNKAWKLYNELKKRGQKPDSHTYTIMLRGLSQNSRKTGSAERAVGVYNSMSAPNSAVVPNTIHTNAVLNVCARTGDMESLWAIAGRLPEQGPGAPDRWTFTTILNAIREDATAKVADLMKDPRKVVEEYGKESGTGADMEDTLRSIFEEALKDGRKLWADVSHRWRRANMMIDERLVFTMGRLILGCGTRNDFGEVFDLVDATMNIKLLERGYKKGSSMEAEPSQGSRQDLESDVNSAEETALTAAKHSLLPLSDSQVYATPSQHTLSLILKAALDLRDMKLGRAYWHFLTTQNGPHKIEPDADNIISYLRLLRVSRASSDALDLLSRDWPAPIAAELYRRGTFVIAMSTCVRDKNNPHVFDSADKLLALMQDKLEEKQLGMFDQIKAAENDPSLTFKQRQAAAKARMAQVDDITFGEDEGLSELQRTKSGVESSVVDPKALKMYLDLAVLKTNGWNEGLSARDSGAETFERNATKNITLRALRRLGPDAINIMRLAKLKIMESEISRRPHPAAQRNDFSRNGQLQVNDRAGTRVAERLEDMVDLLRSIVSALDKVISIDERFEDQNRPRIDKRLVETYRDQKRRVSGFLSRTKDEVQNITRGSLKFAKWRGKRSDDEEDLDEDDAEEDDVDDNRPVRRRNTNNSRDIKYNSRRSQSASNSTNASYMPTIAKEVRRVYEDTDRSLGRLEQRSRRQRQERKVGVQTRMKRRLGVGEDPGVLDDDLKVRKREEVEGRMRQRAFRIGVDSGRGNRGGEGDGMRQLREASASAAL